MQAPQLPQPGRRIAVIGSTGSGKSTLAQQLSARLGLTHIEMDALHFGENWYEVPNEQFRQRIAAATAGPDWITDGNYSIARDIVWARADTLIWLDYSFAFTLSRLTRRTLQRIFVRETLWHNNRETFRDQFLSKDSLFLWLVKSYPKNKRVYGQLFASDDYAQAIRIRLTSARQTQRWLDALPAR
jgi:adenylate kinase family enzyme